MEENKNTHEVSAETNKKKIIKLIILIIITLLIVGLIATLVLNKLESTKEVVAGKETEAPKENKSDSEANKSDEKDSKEPKILKTVSEYNEKVKNSKGIILVDYFATWCPPCKVTAPFIENMQNDGLKVYKVDVDNTELRKIVSEEGVRALPTFVTYKDGKELSRALGVLSETQLRQMYETGKRPGLK